MSVFKQSDFELAWSDANNTFKERSLRILKARIKELESELYELQFVYETLRRLPEEFNPSDGVTPKDTTTETENGLRRN